MGTCWCSGQGRSSNSLVNIMSLYKMMPFISASLVRPVLQVCSLARRPCLALSVKEDGLTVRIAVWVHFGAREVGYNCGGRTFRVPPQK